MTDGSSHVLLVDDDTSVLRLMSAVLSAHAELRFARSGVEALQAVRQSLPDLIVLDIEMPDMGGFEFCDALKADPLLASIPVIVATSHTSTAIELAALGHGAVDFVTKPIVPSQLAARVRAQLRTQRLCRDLMLAATVVAPPAPPAARTRAVVLIVDENLGSTALLRDCLAGLGEVHCAIDGASAETLARRLRPDLIVLDIGLPGHQGFAVYDLLRDQLALRHVPVVFIGRSADPADELRALDLGAADYIATPCTCAVLRARLRNLVQAKGRVDERIRELGERWRHIGDSRITAIVAAAWDAILSHDGDGKVVLANAAAGRLFDIPTSRLVGSPIADLLGPDLPAPGEDGGTPARLVVTRGNGERFPAEVSVSRSGTGALALTTVVLRDASEREQLEAERRERAEMAAQAQATHRMLTFVAHEMGNPLNALLGFAQLMLSDTDHSLPDVQRARLKHVLSGGEQLRALLADLSEMRLVPGAPFSLHLCRVDAAACAESAVASLAALAAHAGVAVTWHAADSACGVEADPERLRQCLLNLLTNALKYNSVGGSVQVEVTEADAGVAIAIRDNGPGMDAAQCERLFEPFNRLGREGGPIPGTGLGLVITRQLVEAMHGALRVESAPGRGSCFTIVLPRAPEVLKARREGADNPA